MSKATIAERARTRKPGEEAEGERELEHAAQPEIEAAEELDRELSGSPAEGGEAHE